MIKQSKYFDMQTSDDVHTLTIAEAFPEDQGEYVVTAKNSAGQVTTTARLTVSVVIYVSKCASLCSSYVEFSIYCHYVIHYVIHNFI